MLNYILPPIIIIISVSFLILFLFRKVRQIPARELLAEERGNEERKVTSAKVMPAFGQFGLKILERLMHKSKLLSLKFHNISNDWFHSIHEKRQQHALIRKEAMEKEMQKAEEEPQPAAQVFPSEDILQTKKRVRPLIREAVVRPQPVMKERNRLEEVLIKRIAINPKDIEAYERLGDYYLESRNYRDSQECFKQVLRLSPSHSKARLRIRRIEKMIG
jgi:tetratricopeptide (TPR) repeat protein